ncbi:hypothetical protein SPHINGO391_120002 [Sphingomonas aurantiaca]|uniref:Uncharacterized protein n=1 Tax=Sphingomonas aurantiaca TaxID=185949 RepID=A0A5E7XRG9_9SPHN|nr:hypothetical protein SPHINGO391_120002 [Sphingomonas aurantiaca]
MIGLFRSRFTIHSGNVWAVSLAVRLWEVTASDGNAWTADRNEASISLWAMKYPISAPVLL